MLLGLTGLLFPQHPTHNRVLEYFAEPRINHSSYKKQECIEGLIGRKDWDHSPQFGFAPPDFQVFKKRFELLSHNNRAYSIVSKYYPTVQELEELSTIEPCWSILFPIKIFLLHHPELARAYRGMLPYGKEVIAFYNNCPYDAPEIMGKTPTYAEHEYLRTMTNLLADHTGWSTVMLNNMMYLEGQKLRTASESGVEE
jgi:hypothetical protein